MLGKEVLLMVMQETDIVTYVASQEIFDKIYNFLNGNCT